MFFWWTQNICERRIKTISDFHFRCAIFCEFLRSHMTVLLQSGKMLLTMLPIIFSNFSCMFLNPNILNYNCSDLLDIRNLQEEVKKAFCYQKLFWPFTVWINCSSDLKSFSRSLEQFFLTVGQKNFGNKIPYKFS